MYFIEKLCTLVNLNHVYFLFCVLYYCIPKLWMTTVMAMWFISPKCLLLTWMPIKIRTTRNKARGHKVPSQLRSEFLELPMLLRGGAGWVFAPFLVQSSSKIQSTAHYPPREVQVMALKCLAFLLWITMEKLLDTTWLSSSLSRPTYWLTKAGLEGSNMLCSLWISLRPPFSWSLFSRADVDYMLSLEAVALHTT